MFALFLLAIAIADAEPPLTTCASSLPQTIMACTYPNPATWHTAKRYIFELNRDNQAEALWHLPSLDELSAQRLPCGSNLPEVDQWWMSAAFLQHGEEVLVGAYHCGKGVTEFVPVTQKLKLMLVR